MPCKRFGYCEREGAEEYIWIISGLPMFVDLTSSGCSGKASRRSGRETRKRSATTTSRIAAVTAALTRLPPGTLSEDSALAASSAAKRTKTIMNLEGP